MTRAKITLPPGTKVPDHMAIVLDGNRRWARARGLHTFEGHKAGFDAALKVVEASRDVGIHTVTVWGFSTENWDRSKEEIDYLMTLYWRFVKKIKDRAKKEEVRFVHLGRKDRFPKDLMAYIAKLEDETRDYKKHVLNVALDYGGRDEILRAIKKIVADKIPEDKIDEKLFSSYLDTGDQPYPNPDLFIRPSGEQRTSGLMPWQNVYAEYYWETDHLPDMTPDKLRTIIMDYSRRRRRFGGNDTVQHFKFNPVAVAKMELDWRHALAMGEDEKFRSLVLRYVKEHYGLSKELTKSASYNLAEAILHGEKKNWDGAKSDLKKLYEIIKKTFGLALEPDFVASIEVDIWKHNGSAEKAENALNMEKSLRELYSEMFRVSDLQMTKAAHLSALATAERDQAIKLSGNQAESHWARSQWYTELFYKALKDRVA